MKAARISVILLAAVTLVFGLAGAAFAFHDGGVGFCEGCHTMHNSVTAGTVAYDSTVTSGSTWPQMTRTALHTAGVTGWTGTALNGNTANGITGTVGNAMNQYMLRGSDPSSTCLNCHAATGNSPLFFQEMSIDTAHAGSVQNPGGDFAWIETSYTYTLVNPDGTTATATSAAGNHGHQVVAADFGLTAGNSLFASGAPGSSLGSSHTAYPAANLACNSCHDPHGKATILLNKRITGSGSYGAVAAGTSNAVGPFRLLAGPSYDPGGAAQYDPTGADGLTYVGFPVQVGAVNTSGYGGIAGFGYVNGGANINAVAPNPYNWTENDNTNTHHNVYGEGMSEFCANCHNELLNSNNTSGTTTHRHPAGNLNPANNGGNGMMDAVYGNYNDYAGTGSYGSNTGGYWGIVPFEEGVNAGPASSLASQTTSSSILATVDDSQVMCLTCHRAHASAFDHDTRWDTYATFMSNSSVEMSGQLSSTQKWEAVYNSAAAQGTGVAGTYQRQLCNKCHVQD